nr:hypothetical protein [Actinomyces sp.]
MTDDFFSRFEGLEQRSFPFPPKQDELRTPGWKLHLSRLLQSIKDFLGLP